VHRLLVEEQQDGGADVAPGCATAPSGTSAAGAATASVRPAATARVSFAGGEVLGRVVELVTGEVPALHGVHVIAPSRC
jgi:hypothetical protein